ncbi:hypothetical protein B0H14DRAFT_3437637 [Mycena olivaceomarginata]|nr:hypothetical protein B0H14DRAFT_3437637 [Mycena olivaceomarginata]
MTRTRSPSVESRRIPTDSDFGRGSCSGSGSGSGNIDFDKRRSRGWGVDPRPTCVGVPDADHTGWVSRARRRRGDGWARGAGTVGGTAVKVIRSHDDERALAFIPARIGWAHSRGPVVDAHRCAERDNRGDGSGVGGNGWLVLACPSVHTTGACVCGAEYESDGEDQAHQRREDASARMSSTPSVRVVSVGRHNGHDNSSAQGRKGKGQDECGAATVWIYQ